MLFNAIQSHLKLFKFFKAIKLFNTATKTSSTISREILIEVHGGMSFPPSPQYLVLNWFPRSPGEHFTDLPLL